MTLLIAAIALQQLTATLSAGPNQTLRLTVIDTEGRKHTTNELKVDAGGLQLKDRIAFEGHNYSATEMTIKSEANKSVDVFTISEKHKPPVPDAPIVFRSKGGIRLDKSIMWLFSWDAWETNSEPSSGVLAVEILPKAEGQPTIGRVALIKGLGEHLNYLRYMRRGNRMVMWSTGTTSFDLSTWSEGKSIKGGGVVVGPSALYFSSRTAFSEMDVDSMSLKSIASANFGSALGSFKLIAQDVLVFEEGVYAVKTHHSYRFPRWSLSGNARVFVVPNVGVGIVDYTAFPNHEPGIFLEGPYLKPAAIIRPNRARNLRQLDNWVITNDHFTDLQ